MPTADNLSVTGVAFADGSARNVPVRFADQVRGLDADGDLVIADKLLSHNDGTEYLIALTPCCFGSGKGSADSPTGICCRGCYRTVDAKFGGPATVTWVRSSRRPDDHYPVTTAGDDVTLRRVRTARVRAEDAAGRTLFRQRLRGLGLPDGDDDGWVTLDPDARARVVADATAIVAAYYGRTAL
jgi:hypothetical protein